MIYFKIAKLCYIFLQTYFGLLYFKFSLLFSLLFFQHVVCEIKPRARLRIESVSHKQFEPVARRFAAQFVRPTKRCAHRLRSQVDCHQFRQSQPFVHNIVGIIVIRMIMSVVVVVVVVGGVAHHRWSN